MAKGTIYGTTGGVNIESKIEWSSVASTSTNSSVVTASLYYRRTNQGFTTSGTGSFILSIDGSKKLVQKYISIGDTDWTEVLTETKIITHSGDGTKRITISAGGSIPKTSLSSTNCSGTVELDTIPRASTLDSLSCSTSYFTGELTSKYTPKSTSFYNRCKIFLELNGTYLEIRTINLGEKTASQNIETVTLTDEELESIYNKLPNTNKGVLRFSLRTYSDSGYSDQIGDVDYKDITLYIPNDSTTKPSVSMSLSPVHSLSSTFSGLYIQGKSKVKADFTGSSAKYSSTIDSYSMTVSGLGTYNDSPYQSGWLSKDGSVTVTGSARDTRGYSASIDKTITVIPYSKPSVIPYGEEKSIVCARCTQEGTLNPSGTYLRIKAGRKYSKVMSGSTQKNFCLLRYRYKTESAISYSDWMTLLSKGTTSSDQVDKVLEGITLDTKTSYVVQISAVDDIESSSPLEFSVPTEEVVIHLRKGGKGAAFGKYAEQDNLLECEWNAKFNKKTTLNGVEFEEKEIFISGDANTYYPVHIKPTYYGESQPVFVGIGKAIGSTSGNWDGNHSNGTSSLMIGWLCRFNGWDGNGSYMTTLYKSEIYGKVIAHVKGFDNSAKGIVVYLRGGGASYKIACSVPIVANVYLSESNISDNHDYTVNVSPREYIGNKGVLYDTNGLSDVIIEEGTSGIWHYRKWNNGKLECWGKRSVSVNISEPWGAVYYGSVDAVDFPFEFIEAPICQVTAEHGSTLQAAWLCVAGKATVKKTPNLMFCRPGILTEAGFNILYYAIGNWK